MNTTPFNDGTAQSLSETYRRGDDQVAALFGSAHCSDIEAWSRRAARLDQGAGGRADRRRLGEALADYQRRLDSGALALKHVEALAGEGALAVVGGQQAGLFGGPLLIAYKALTVIQAAKHASRSLGRPVVPVFWIAGEDHDFEEANHLYVSPGEGEPRKVKLTRPEGPRHAVSRTTLAAVDWEVALTELALTLPDTEFKPNLLRQIRGYASDAPTLTLAFARLLSDWFAEDGLVLMDADDPAIRRLEAGMFRELVVRSEELSEALAAGEASVRQLGYPIQAESAPDGANLFVHAEQGRTLLFRQGDRFEDRKGGLAYGRDELLRMAEERPEQLSNNALSRPLMQDYLLPVLATVLGPSEIAYWASLGPAFAAFGLEMPIIVPRQSFTYLEPQVEKLLAKYGVTAEQIASDGGRMRSDWLSAQDTWDIGGRFADARARFGELYAPLLDMVSQVDRGLAKLGESNMSLILEQISYLEQRTAGALAGRHEASLRQWDRMLHSIRPLEQPQERIYGIVHFINRYGTGWLAALRCIPFDVTGGHRLMAQKQAEPGGRHQEVCCS
ncbi:bacillithiol biosynthesis cysteine-adding enzyme BshC [Cohnella sp. JJ-181]|uniref:bacillithiol biosynthesis cysteine-adding enzyme BshC n=1 Tax=Cohnella rhizoplanae TaxID=2974897 RepID=UPI0022FF98D3|nr:bacillithiol biosynthesis cysteine-adding enzyme BshC [Cohnella sp. JJ-181]CAI6019942.1 Putative cysteine ligase BshC [Cohnella sp. JJ-181]